jgi:RNA polymerase sigma-70 factor, ECF subfamily
MKIVQPVALSAVPIAHVSGRPESMQPPTVAKLGPLGVPPVVAKTFSDELLLLLPFLRSFARSLTRHREMAEDLAQEALVKAWQNRASFVPGTNLKAWVFMIVRNQFYSDKRRAWRNQPWDDASAEKVLVSPSSQLASVTLSEVAGAINLLPVLQQNAIVLVGAGGLPYDEAAVICGCAIGTIKSRVARARRAIESATIGAVAVPVALRPAPGGAVDAILCKLALITGPAAIPVTRLAVDLVLPKINANIGVLCPARGGVLDIGVPTLVPPVLFTA